MTGEVWTIRAALEWCRGYLERKGDENPRLSAEWLLCEACGMRRVDLYVNFDRPLSLEEREVLRGWVSRRAAGEPLQYITGEVAFRHIAVKVREGVLIPRPETEILVSEALALLPAPQRRRAVDSTITQSQFDEMRLAHMAKAVFGVADTDESSQAPADDSATDVEIPEPAEDDVLYVADICTGTGCIACSIAYENPKTRVLACDISPDAIALAKENVASLGLAERVAVLCGNLGEPVGERFMGELSLVVSNPPYIPTEILKTLSAEVAEHEPELALDGGLDGLDLYRPLAKWAFLALASGGGFAVELHETCLDAAAEIAKSVGFTDIRIVPDLANRPRVLTARKPKASL